MVNGSELSSFDEDTLPRSFKYHSAVGAIQYLTWTRPETVFTVKPSMSIYVQSNYWLLHSIRTDYDVH